MNRHKHTPHTRLPQHLYDLALESSPSPKTLLTGTNS